MDEKGIQCISELANKKTVFYSTSISKYIISAILAGVFCGLGMILAYSAGGNLDYYEATKGLSKIVFGISFALSFTLIVYAGSELFTGNVLVMVVSTLNNTVRFKKAVHLMITVYLGNFLGATLIATLIGQTGLLDNIIVGQYLVSSTELKMALPFTQALTRGILCNMLVCLATWAISKIKSEPGKMLILVWCVYGFVTSGFEHSIANMALFVMARFSAYSTSSVTIHGYFNNIIPVTLGNILGGALVGLMYYYIGCQPLDKSNRQNTHKTLNG